MFQLFSRTSQQRSVFRCLLRCILWMSTKASNPLDESPVEHKLEKGGRAILCECANSKVRVGASSGNCTSKHVLKKQEAMSCVLKRVWWYKPRPGVKPGSHQTVLQKAKTGNFFTFNKFSFLVLISHLITSFSWLGVPDFGQRKAKGEIRYKMIF